MACLLGATKVFHGSGVPCTATSGPYTGILDLGKACGAAKLGVGTAGVGVHPRAACVGRVASHFISCRPGQRVPRRPRPALPRHRYRQAVCRDQARPMWCLHSHSLVAALKFTCHPPSEPAHGPCPAHGHHTRNFNGAQQVFFLTLKLYRIMPGRPTRSSDFGPVGGRTWRPVPGLHWRGGAGWGSVGKRERQVCLRRNTWPPPPIPLCPPSMYLRNLILSPYIGTVSPVVAADLLKYNPTTSWLPRNQPRRSLGAAKGGIAPGSGVPLASIQVVILNGLEMIDALINVSYLP